MKVGYPDSWESCLDDAEIKSPAEGGSFFSNVIAIQMAMKKDVLAHQNDAPDKLRCNRVLQTLTEFYTTYGIQPSDGMWTAPETRVSVW